MHFGKQFRKLFNPKHHRVRPNVLKMYELIYTGNDILRTKLGLFYLQAL